MWNISPRPIRLKSCVGYKRSTTGEFEAEKLILLVQASLQRGNAGGIQRKPGIPPQQRQRFRYRQAAR